MKYQIRFYKNDLPKKNDLVIGMVKNINETIIDVDLIEYDNIHAMLPLSEVTKRKRIKSIKQYIKENKTYVFQVTEVNEINKSVDLSYKYLDDNDKEKKKKEYSDYTMVLKIFYHFMYDVLKIKVNENEQRNNLDKNKLLEKQYGDVIKKIFII